MTTIESESLESWIRTTLGYAEGYFGNNHQRVRELTRLLNTVRQKDISDNDKAELELIKKKTIQYVNDFIDDLKDLKKQEKTNYTTKYPSGLSQELFWTVLIAIVGVHLG